MIVAVQETIRSSEVAAGHENHASLFLSLSTSATRTSAAGPTTDQ
jgi:hypothetical protein